MFGHCSANVSYTWDQNIGCHIPFNSYCHPFNQNPFPQDYSSHSEVTAVLDARRADEQFLRHFAETTGKHDFRAVSISETKETLKTIQALKEKLKDFAKELTAGKLSDEEWEKKREHCEQMKKKVQSLMSSLKRDEFLNKFCKVLEKRKKKRSREKKARADWQRKKEEMKERRIRLHNEADNWIKNRQNIIDKEKQGENLRREADLVLFDVRTKRGHARKYLTLLRELDKLRKVKVTIAKARGEIVSAAADAAFNNIIEKLVKQWTALDREYSLEEQGLKLMIQTNNEMKTENQKKNPYECWEIALFGKQIPNDYFLHGDFNTFVTMRTVWDKFLDANKGTPIPVGWIMPDEPSSNAWQRCLKKD